MKKLAIILGFLLVGIEAESSILSSLREKGNYTYYLRLIKEVDADPYGIFGGYGFQRFLEYASENPTVFAADDAGWQHFFEKNATLPQSDPWHTATSYEALYLAP